MPTFDLAEVRRFATEINATNDRCDNGEGLECANLDGTLRHYATVCWKFRGKVRQWGQEVFSGRVAFDPEVEKVFQEEGVRLLHRASSLLAYGEELEEPCWSLEGMRSLAATLWALDQLLRTWVTPQRAVGPSARLGLPLSPASAEHARRRIELLPPLPADWQPEDLRQQMRFKKLRSRHNP